MARRVIALWACASLTCELLGWLGSPSAGSGARAAPPPAQSRLRQLESPEAGWPLSLPERNGTEVVLPRSEAVVAGTGARQVLTFEVRLTARPQAPVRMVFHVQNRQGWYYQTSRGHGIPTDRWWRIAIDFSATTRDWEAVGHARPWDTLSARGIVRAGIRVFSQLPYEGALLVRGVRWKPKRERALAAAIVDLRAQAGPVRPGELWELSFRLSRPAADPFESEPEGIACEIVTPEGGTRHLLAFHYQDYEANDKSGRLVALGAPEWRVRFRPSERGRYLYRLFTSGVSDRKEEREGPPQAEGWFAVEGSAPPRATEAGKVVGDFAPFLLELGSGEGGPRRLWRPDLANVPAVFRGGAFRREAVPRPVRVWRPLVEWTVRWGKWEGLGAYDMERAWSFDRVLAEAEAGGVALPMALLDDGPFLHHGTYRWPLNPLSRGEGGPLAGPGEFFTSEAARQFFLRRARYLVARWGHSPAVSGWCIASGLPASGVADWHEHVGREIAGLVSRAGLRTRATLVRPPAASSPQTVEPRTQSSRGGPEAVEEETVVSLHPFAVSFSRERRIGEFEAGHPSGWRLDAKDSPGVQVGRAKDRGSGGGDALGITVPAGGVKATVFRPMDDNLFDYDYLTFDVRMPESSEGVGRAQVIVRDRDLLWYEILSETPLRAGDWTRCVVDLTSAGSKLEAVDHKRPWGGYTRSRVRQLAIRLFPNGRAEGPILLDHVKLFAGARASPARPQISLRYAGPEEVGRFDKYEMILDITPDFSNPFDPDCVALDVTFRHEGGTEHAVPGFFYEPYERRLVKVKIKGREREKEELEVAGPPDWRVRFAPPETGRYTSVIRVKTKHGVIDERGPAFKCVKSGRKGFIRVASDNRYFEHSTGEIFYPVGPVIRSPSDERDIGRDPSIREAIIAAGSRGTYQFEEYFEAMRGAGTNWIRMWLCSWWCGLEWYRKWPGFGGTGWYNLQNAYRLDHVIEAAEACGVYVQLCLQNHGQASIRIDHEWEYNPYNRYEPEAFPHRRLKDRPQQPVPAAANNPRFLRPAGWVEHAHDFFSDQRVRKARRNYYRYVVARWSHSTNVLAWVLASEIEFTGEYQRVQYGQDDHDLKVGRWPEGPDRAVHTLDWHRDLAAYISKIDPAHHVVTTHFSHPHRGREIWKLKEIGYVQSNAYSAFRAIGWFTGNPQGPSGCAPVPTVMKEYWTRFVGRYGKPVLIGEWGGHWMRNSVQFLDAELHTGTWASIMTPMAGATGFWWWLHVHYRDRYGVYTAVTRFLKGEDRRGLGLELVQVKFENDNKQLDAVAISNGRQADVYIYQKQHAFKLGSRPPVKGATMILPGMKTGTYVVETWDTVKGEPTGEHPAMAIGGDFKYELAEVPGDIALKVRPIDMVVPGAQTGKKR